jgi:Lrp/AsnC family leucine-responsive transcriptional regulator
MIDEIDIKILNILKENSKTKWKDIGSEIHMTGQAVGMRIKRLEEKEIIKAYTILIDELKISKQYLAFITVFMKANNHTGFQIYINSEPSIVEAHRISGDGCYMLKVKLESEEKLNMLLDEVLKYGNYRLNISINMIK